MGEKSRPIKNIVLFYFIFGILWILFSDTLAGYLINDLDFYQSFQFIKGILFIFITGIFLYYLLKTNLKEITEKEEFELYYQPKLRCFDHKICGLEALICWRHPDRGMVSPYKFIKLAEETGLIIEIGDWVLEEVFKQLLKWQQKYEDQFSLTVNLSPLELYDQHKIKKKKTSTAISN